MEVPQCSARRARPSARQGRRRAAGAARLCACRLYSSDTLPNASAGSAAASAAAPRCTAAPAASNRAASRSAASDSAHGRQLARPHLARARPGQGAGETGGRGATCATRSERRGVNQTQQEGVAMNAALHRGAAACAAAAEERRGAAHRSSERGRAGRRGAGRGPRAGAAPAQREHVQERAQRVQQLAGRQQLRAQRLARRRARLHLRARAPGSPRAPWMLGLAADVQTLGALQALGLTRGCELRCWRRVRCPGPLIHGASMPGATYQGTPLMQRLCPSQRACTSEARPAAARVTLSDTPWTLRMGLVHAKQCRQLRARCAPWQAGAGGWRCRASGSHRRRRRRAPPPPPRQPHHRPRAPRRRRRAPALPPRRRRRQQPRRRPPWRRPAVRSSAAACPTRSAACQPSPAAPLLPQRAPRIVICTQAAMSVRHGRER